MIALDQECLLFGESSRVQVPRELIPTQMRNQTYYNQLVYSMIDDSHTTKQLLFRLHGD